MLALTTNVLLYLFLFYFDRYAIKKLKMPFNSEMRNEFLKCPEYTESKLIFSLATSNEISRFAVISEECFFDRANYLYYASEFSEVT